MPEPSADVFSFSCPHCNHRLKAKMDAAGRRAKCSKCQQLLTVPVPPNRGHLTGASPIENVSGGPLPGKQTDAPSTEPAAGLSKVGADDWQNLGQPAIADLSERQRAYEANQEAKERERRAKQNKHRMRMNSTVESNEHRHPASGQPFLRSKTDVSNSPQTTSTPSSAKAPSASSEDELDDHFRLAPLDSHRITDEPPTGKSAKADDGNDLKRSVFDDDLPVLAELQSSNKPSRKIDDLLASHVDDRMPAADALGPLLPDLEPVPKGKPKPLASGKLNDPEYRIACSACGTAQYVRLSQKGKSIKCPDCFLQFRIPPPPPNWVPDEQAQQRARENDWHTSSGDSLQAADPQESQRSRANRMLEKAEQQVSDEDLDTLYDTDFDNATFLLRTFGFLRDPVAIAYIVGYAIVFAGVFAGGQFAANQSETQVGKGVLLAVTLGVPVIGLLFLMPMLSGCIALIESVANRQQRVADWPGFNLFDNAGDMLAITAALLGSVVPGFLLGTWLGGEDAGAGRIQIAGMMSSSLFLFPIFLLSMLDNGSLFAPISNAVLRSLREATEAWGGYFLKTMIAFATVMLLWLLLLGEGKPVALAAIAGSLFPMLVFFTCQQIGALADSISEHLSFEFVPGKDEGNDEAKPKPTSDNRGKLNS